MDKATFRKYLQPAVDSLRNTENEIVTGIGACMMLGHNMPEEFKTRLISFAREAETLRHGLIAYRASLQSSEKQTEE